MKLLILTALALGLSSCGHGPKTKELCPLDTHLISYPEAGHGPNPFKEGQS